MHDTDFHISCPTDCSSTYDPGNEVVLVAEPDSGSTFEGWSGAGCSGTQSCIVTMSADQSVTATFLEPGHGTVTAPVPKTRRHRQIRAKITMGWRWDDPSTTTLTGRSPTSDTAPAFSQTTPSLSFFTGTDR